MPGYVGHEVISPAKKRVIDSILSVFETGKPEGDYGACVVLPDGAGITYGKHQSTDGYEDSLDKIVIEYIERDGYWADQLAFYLDKLEADATTRADPNNLPPWVQDLMSVLVVASEDPIMRAVQDDVFDAHYWNPAAEQALEMGLEEPLSWLVCYDSTIQSGKNGIRTIRARFPELPPSKGGEESAWVAAYLRERRKYLLSIPHAAFSVYRVDAMLAMLDDHNWSLETPIEIAKPKATVT